MKDCTNPEQALQNWMQRDIRFAKWIEQEALQQGMRVLVVNGTSSLAENTSIVEQHFQLGQSES